ncbi:MAG TPA: 3-deoxy-7-phosphoheptulonate synthase [Elusimicrobia bacterium]|nr:3-deoxy-7-phosphoheptulonate synthase [Elusimicrobiota bacterium]
MIIKLTHVLSPRRIGILKRKLAQPLAGANLETVKDQILVTGLKAEKTAEVAAFIENIPGVSKVEFEIDELCPLAMRTKGHPLPERPLNFVKNRFIYIAGPCAVENEKNYLASALALKKAGAHALRAALFKPRSSPYTFQGIGFKGLPIILKAKKLTGLPLVTEATDTRQIEKLSGAVDIIQIGARNMRNYELLKEIGRSGKPALLKRAMLSTLGEWLLSAEYLLKYGCKTLILCERGDSTFTSGKTGLNLELMRKAKSASGLPVLTDPSHSSKNRILAERFALEAAASGADGLLIEASVSPETALVDGAQTLGLPAFGALVKKTTKLHG